MSEYIPSWLALGVGVAEGEKRRRQQKDVDKGPEGADQEAADPAKDSKSD